MVVATPYGSAAAAPERDPLLSGATGATEADSSTASPFADASGREKAREAARANGWLVIDVAVRSRRTITDCVATSIEHALAERGAPPAGLLASAGDAEARLRDQMFRARRAGARGVLLLMGAMGPAAKERGAIDPDDAATLSFLSSAALMHPSFRLLLDESDAGIPAHAEPISLRDLVARSRRSVVPPPSPSTAPAAAPPSPSSSAAATEVADAPPPNAPLAAPLSTLPCTASVEPPAWQAWRLALDAARGPQPLSVFERLFEESYLPLVNALARGLDDARARASATEFRRTFSRAYGDAFPTFAVTGKRPRLVFDAPDLAARSARLHGARATSIVMVTAMRFDVGARVKSELLLRLGEHGSLASEHVLYSALPSAKRRQLDGLARGIDAYRGVPARMDVELFPSLRSGAQQHSEAGRSAGTPRVTSDDELRRRDPRASNDAETGNDTDEDERVGLRMRSSRVPRRIRTGARDLLELDLLEALLGEAVARDASPTSILQACDTSAIEAAGALARHARSLPSRSLLFVFGDHGFTLDGARGVPRHGGAAPEEVIVPAFSVLVHGNET